MFTLANPPSLSTLLQLEHSYIYLLHFILTSCLHLVFNVGNACLEFHYQFCCISMQCQQRLSDSRSYSSRWNALRSILIFAHFLPNGMTEMYFPRNLLSIVICCHRVHPRCDVTWWAAAGGWWLTWESMVSAGHTLYFSGAGLFYCITSASLSVL